MSDFGLGDAPAEWWALMAGLARVDGDTFRKQREMDHHFDVQHRRKKSIADLQREGRVFDRCPRCSSPAELRWIFIETRMMREPPRTRCRWIRIVHWQCYSREDHRGEYEQPTDEKTPPEPQVPIRLPYVV